MAIRIRVRSGENKTEQVYDAVEGERLYEVLVRNGVVFNAPCGGRGVCGKCRVKVEGNLSSAPGGYFLACKTYVTGDCCITIQQTASSILTNGAVKMLETDGKPGLAIAVDVGTTTLAAYLLDRKNGKEIARASMLNPQRIYGADVITRLNYACSSKEAKRQLHTEIIKALQDLKSELLCKAEINANERISVFGLVGNTVMMHLACMYDAAGIAKAPYLPYYTAQHMRDLDGMRTLIGGCISGYVGADTVAAMLACDFDKTDKTTLLIDIGTNGEIAIKHKSRYLCCSCAAGPAFEGAHIACGTGAVEGAIDHLKIDEGRCDYSTIGNKPAIGICGSGLIDIVAALAENELITPVGRMKNRFNITQDVYLDPSDIHEMQLAKAAIAAGIEILTRRMGITYSQVDEVLLAGGFGNYMDVSSACTIGLIPMELKAKVRNVGNAAGDGAKMLALNTQCAYRAESIRLKTEYIDLAAEEDFEDVYTDNLLFDI